MFSRQHRKTRPLFVLADIFLIWLAFEAAYETRSHLRLERPFYLSESSKTLLILSASLGWAVIGWWLDVYDSILKGPWRSVVSGAIRQSLWATGAVVVCLRLLTEVRA